jgi:6-pyruvoyltetrahydropterin/6-carboxytetrahydropterin synthase
MFTLALRKKFIAHHRNAVEPDPEHPLRSHLYLLEVMLEAEALDSEGMVLDLDELANEIENILDLYRDKNLNELAPFQKRIPTLEALARVLGDAIDESLYAPHLTAISVRLWRDEEVWALYDIEK